MKDWGHVSAIAFVAVAITATAVEVSRKEGTPVEANAPRPTLVVADPLVAELTRCSEAGEMGGRDHTCLRAWAKNRRRFLGPGARPMAMMPEPELPAAPRAGEGR